MTLQDQLKQALAQVQAKLELLDKLYKLSQAELEQTKGKLEVLQAQAQAWLTESKP
jgi:hypothetical protein